MFFDPFHPCPEEALRHFVAPLPEGYYRGRYARCAQSLLVRN